MQWSAAPGHLVSGMRDLFSGVIVGPDNLRTLSLQRAASNHALNQIS
jgi:hypothetical protein